MAEHSPTPWRVAAYDDSDECDIYSAQGTPVCTMSHFPDSPKADADFIAEAVNEAEAWREERRRLQLEAASAEAAFLNADARLTFLERCYCEVYADRDRLRDIMRGLVAILDTITLEDHEIELLDEAREALGEAAP